MRPYGHSATCPPSSLFQSFILQGFTVEKEMTAICQHSSIYPQYGAWGCLEHMHGPDSHCYWKSPIKGTWMHVHLKWTALLGTCISKNSSNCISWVTAPFFKGLLVACEPSCGHNLIQNNSPTKHGSALGPPFLHGGGCRAAVVSEKSCLQPVLLQELSPGGCGPLWSAPNKLCFDLNL